MQKKSFYFVLVIIMTSITGSAWAQESISISKADSLFEQKKYTESFDIYEQLLEEQSKASPRMLLKMAFIKEGLGDYSAALYYLNIYYLKSSDKRARDKMKDIAEEHQLSGFVINDSDFFLNLINRFRIVIILGLFALALFLLLLILYKKIKLNQKPVIPAIFFSGLLVLMFYAFNFGFKYDQAIIIENHSYLMTGPSSGSDLVEVIDKGHRVKTFGELGPWLEIEWNGERVFIKKDKVKKLG
ncbi:MAG: tetratricopeptide repeat protein [Cyclobacteriaceae bacterium]